MTCSVSFINMLPPDLLPFLHHFATVAHHGSFRAAARQLALSPSAISHAVSTLERRLGISLFNRTTRSVSLTPEGRRLLDGLAPALQQIDAAVESSQNLSRAVVGHLRIAAPHSVSAFLLLPLLRVFTRQHPAITIELHADDSLQDIVADGFDFGIRFGNVLEQDMIAITIGSPTRVILVASPAYLATHGTPDMPEDLEQHHCLGRRFPSGAMFGWSFIKGDEKYTIKPESRLVFNDNLLVRQAALDGLGIGYAFEQTVSEDMAQGRLVEVLPDWAEAPEHCYLYWPRSPITRTAARVFIDFVRESYRTTPGST